MRCETWARVVACLGISSWGEPWGVSSRILVIRGPKGRMKVCIRVVRRERLVRWVISMVFVVVVVVVVGWGLRGEVVSVLGLGRLEGVSRWDPMVVVVSEGVSLVSSIFVFSSFGQEC